MVTVSVRRIVDDVDATIASTPSGSALASSLSPPPVSRPSRAVTYVSC